MRRIAGVSGVFAAAVVAIGLGVAPIEAAGPVPSPGAAAPEVVKPDPSVWQSVISGQIEAFRRGDAPTALTYAGAAFKSAFADPNAFMVSIAAAGYGPIFTSVSHSFGKFAQPDPSSALQIVDFVGPKQELYEAIYSVLREPAGWRIEGVQLARKAGMAV